jgi:photosystem II stability/assembly factor-like uncharacterized protein
MVTDPYNGSVISFLAAAALRALVALAAGAAAAPSADRAGPQSIAGWTSAGPELSQVNAVSADPADDAAVYASGSLFAASQSALYRSGDAGRSWTALEEAPSGEFFAEVYADPRGGGRVFAGSQASGAGTRFSRSTDSGHTWSALMTIPDTCVPSFAPGPTADAIVVACGTRAFASPDAGATWSEPPNPFTEAMKLTAAPGGIVLAYGASAFFRSADGGASWTRAGAAPAACPGMLSLRSDAVNGNSLLAGTGVIGAGGFQCGGVFRSADGGATWTATPLSGVYVTDVRFGPSGTGAVYACASYIAGILPPGGAWGSQDGGASWQDLRLPTPNALKIAVSKSGDHVYAATPLGVYVRVPRQTRTVHR